MEGVSEAFVGRSGVRGVGEEGGVEGYRSMIVIRGATRPEAQAAAVRSEVIRQGRSAVFHLRSAFGGGGRAGFGLEAEKGLGSGRETDGVRVSMRWDDAAASLRGSSWSLLGGIVAGADALWRRWRSCGAGRLYRAMVAVSSALRSSGNMMLLGG